MCLYGGVWVVYGWCMGGVQVVFRARRGVSYMGDVVLDDVSFQRCAPPPAAPRPCRPWEYACSNARCIPEILLCDFIHHCGDGSDEDPYICSTEMFSHGFWDMVLSSFGSNALQSNAFL